MHSECFRFLSLCASLDPSPDQQAAVRHAANLLSDWNTIPALADQHGLAPLVYHHLITGEICPPTAQRRELAVLYARSRSTNAIRLKALSILAHTFQEANLPMIVLKGAALANLIYPEPGLRPMRDLDVLVRASDLHKVNEVLFSLGYRFTDSPLDPDYRHQKELSLNVDGLTVHLEIHQRLLDYPQPTYLTFEDLTGPPIQINLPGESNPILSLSPIDMLLHLCIHLRTHLREVDGLRLIWVVDILQLAARYADQLDWRYIEKHAPLIPSTLQLLGALAPYPEALNTYIPKTNGRKWSGAGEGYTGWPDIPFSVTSTKDHPKLIWHTLFPSPWWLSMVYNPGSIRPSMHDRIVHYRHLFVHFRQILRRRISRPGVVKG